MVDKISIVPHCLVIECVRLRMDFLAIPIRLRSADAAWFRRETKKRPGKQADLFRDMRRAYEREQKALKSRDYVAHGLPVEPSQNAGMASGTLPNGLGRGQDAQNGEGGLK